MASRAVGVFASVEAAECSRDALVAAGVARRRIALSADLTRDGIAAEWSGQSYEHQSYRSSDGAGWLRSLFGGNAGTDTEWARVNEAIRTGACAMSVASQSESDCRRLRELMLRTGARIALAAPNH